MLAVGAIEIRDPIAILVEAKAEDRALHRSTWLRLAWITLPFVAGARAAHGAVSMSS